MNIILIAAVDKNGAIGKDGEIPWYVQEDLKFFKAETKNHAIIMGRKTWESLPVKPLGGRLNCVISRNSITGADASCKSIQDGIKACIDAGYKTIYGIGGYSIYKEMIDIANELVLTEVEMEVKDPDTYFPEFNRDEWKEIESRVIRKDRPFCRLSRMIRKRV